MADEVFLMRIAHSIQHLSNAELTSNQRVLAVIWEIEAEVNNGGFRQYFFNGSGRRASQATAALATIGASKCSAIAARAFALTRAVVSDWQDDRLRQ